jgi:hypothetical protein
MVQSALALSLGGVHQGIGEVQQGVNTGRRLHARHHPETAIDRPSAALHRLQHTPLELIRHEVPRRLTSFGEEDSELIPAKTSHDVRTAYPALQRLGNFAQ